MMFNEQFKSNKFRNKKTAFGGRLYASKLESSVAADLELAKRAVNKEDRVIKIIPQFPIDFYFDGLTLTDKAKINKTVKLFRYYPDFYVEYADGKKEIIEVKGHEHPVWKIKWKLTEILYAKKYPDIILRIIK